MGFKLVSEEGTDMSFVLHIENGENGKIGGVCSLALI